MSPTHSEVVCALILLEGGRERRRYLDFREVLNHSKVLRQKARHLSNLNKMVLIKNLNLLRTTADSLMKLLKYFVMSSL